MSGTLAGHQRRNKSIEKMQFVLFLFWGDQRQTVVSLLSVARVPGPSRAHVAMATGPFLWRGGGRRYVKWGRNNFSNVQEPNWNSNPLSH